MEELTVKTVDCSLKNQVEVNRKVKKKEKKEEDSKYEEQIEMLQRRSC